MTMLALAEDPIANHIREIASYFDAKLDESNYASTITMDNHKAKGFISSYRLFSGLTVWAYNITFFSDFKVDLELSDDNPYYFSYIIKGHFFHKFGHQEEFAKILQNQNMIVSGASGASVQIIFPANIGIKIAVLLVDTKLLDSLDIRNVKRIYTKVGEVFQNIPKDRPYRHIGGIHPETEQYASIVCENNSIDLVGELLAEGAAHNMLASQIKGYREDISEMAPQSILSRSELAKITSLGDYVISNFETSLTILKLSKHFGMNPKKLQVGVKHLYGDTIGHYISNLRMGHSKHLLITTDLSISEVCYRVGISSGSYFSRIFKNRYGMLPSHYKKIASTKKK